MGEPQLVQHRLVRADNAAGCDCEGEAQLAFQQCMEEHGIEGGGFTIAVGDGPALDVDERQDDQAAPPPAEIDPEEFQAAAEECQSVYDDYPELDDVFPDGGPMGGVSVGSAESNSGS